MPAVAGLDVTENSPRTLHVCYETECWVQGLKREGWRENSNSLCFVKFAGDMFFGKRFCAILDS